MSLGSVTYTFWKKTVSKHFMKFDLGKSPLQQSANSVTNSQKFHAKVNYSANVTFIAKYIK